MAVPWAAPPWPDCSQVPGRSRPRSPGLFRSRHCSPPRRRRRRRRRAAREPRRGPLAAWGTRAGPLSPRQGPAPPRARRRRSPCSAPRPSPPAARAAAAHPAAGTPSRRRAARAAARLHSRLRFCFRVPPPGPGRPKLPPGSPCSRAAARGQPAPPPPRRRRRPLARQGTASGTPRASGCGDPARACRSGRCRESASPGQGGGVPGGGGDRHCRAIPVPAAGSAADEPRGRGACGVTER